MAAQSFVGQGNFTSESEMAASAVRSGAPTAADFTRGLQVTAAGHAKSTSGVQIQQTTAQIQHPQQVLHTITPDHNFTTSNSIKNEGILCCYTAPILLHQSTLRTLSLSIFAHAVLCILRFLFKI